MTTTDDALTGVSSDSVLYPTFDDDALSELAGFGHRRPIVSGDVLFEPGEDLPNFLVILEGEIELLRLQVAICQSHRRMEADFPVVKRVRPLKFTVDRSSVLPIGIVLLVLCCQGLEVGIDAVDAVSGGFPDPLTAMT